MEVYTLKKLLMLLFACILLTGCFSSPQNDAITDFSSIPKTKLNYKNLKNRADMSAYYTLEDENHAFTDMSLETFYNKLTTSKKTLTGAFYFGYDDCPYCKQAVPILNYVAKEYNSTVSYVNIFSSRYDENGNKLENGDKYYTELQAYLDEYLDKEDKTIYVPTVIFIKNGQISLYQLGLDTDENFDIKKGLNIKGKNNLAEIYRKGFNSIK